MGMDELHPGVLRELGDGIVRPLSIILERSQGSEGLPEDHRKANVTHSLKKGKQGDLGIRIRDNRHKPKHLKFSLITRRHCKGAQTLV